MALRATDGTVTVAEPSSIYEQYGDSSDKRLEVGEGIGSWTIQTVAQSRQSTVVVPTAYPWQWHLLLAVPSGTGSHNWQCTAIPLAHTDRHIHSRAVSSRLLLSSPVIAINMSVRLRQLTAPFGPEHHHLIQTSLYPLHLTARPHIASTSCPTAADYLTTLQTHCTLTQSTIILASLPPSHSQADTADEAIAGFALYRSIHDTFNTLRLMLEELIVHPDARRKGVGSVLLRYVQQAARDLGALYVTAEVAAGWVDCQPLLARQKFGVAALSFTTTSQSPTRAQSALTSPTSPTSPPPPATTVALTASDLTTTIINIANFSSPTSTALLTALEPVYRQLRPSVVQLPLTTAAYLGRLHSIHSAGAFSVVAHSPINPSTVYGVATCRHLHTLTHGRRLHIDDLVTDSEHRSRGVGRALIEAVRCVAAEEERGGGEGKEGREGGVSEMGSVAVTLESGTHRQAAHRFYWREGFLVHELFWRWQVEPSPATVQATADKTGKEQGSSGAGGADANMTVRVS